MMTQMKLWGRCENDSWESDIGGQKNDQLTDDGDLVNDEEEDDDDEEEEEDDDDHNAEVNVHRLNEGARRRKE